jgi:hypothetical protein
MTYPLLTIDDKTALLEAKSKGMRTTLRIALICYLVIGLSSVFLLTTLDFITPAISEDALILSHIWIYFDKFFDAWSFIAAAVGIALLDREGVTK